MKFNWRWWWICYGPAVMFAILGAVVIGLEIKTIRTIDNIAAKIEQIGDPTEHVRTNIRALNLELRKSL